MYSVWNLVNFIPDIPQVINLPSNLGRSQYLVDKVETPAGKSQILQQEDGSVYLAGKNSSPSHTKHTLMPWD